MRLENLIDEQARARPEAVALMDGDTRLSYRQLTILSESAAVRLSELGVTGGSIVALVLPPSSAAVIAMLAVWKSGGVLLPLEHGAPDFELSRVLGHSGAVLAITEEGGRGSLCEKELALSELLHVRSAKTQRRRTAPTADAIAYVIYTSGTTGQPKGVAISHRAITEQLRSLRSGCGLDASDRVLQLMPLHAHTMVREILGTLTSGAVLVFPRRNPLTDPSDTAELIRASGITALLSTPPSLVRRMLARPGPGATALRLTVLCGEGATESEIARWTERFEAAAVVNHFGPTECLMRACELHWQREPSATPGRYVAAGHAAPGMSAYVARADLSPAAPGEVGQLVVGGLIADGYHNAPGTTALRFLPDWRSGTGGRLFLTGDLCRHDDERGFEYLGRWEEFGSFGATATTVRSVEAELLDDPAVLDAVIVSTLSASGAQHRAFLSLCDPLARSVPQRLHERLAASGVTVPPVVVELLPRLRSGKVDRSRLALDVERPDLAPVPPLTSEGLAWRAVEDTQGRPGLLPASMKIPAGWAQRRESDAVTLDGIAEAGGT